MLKNNFKWQWLVLVHLAWIKIESLDKTYERYVLSHKQYATHPILLSLLGPFFPCHVARFTHEHTVYHA